MALNVATKSQSYLRLRAASLGARLRAVPRPLAVLLAVGLLLSVAWATANAPLQGPDEIAHVSYVQNLAENGTTPESLGGSGTESGELATADYFFGLHPSVGVIDARPMWSEADRRAYAAIAKTLPPSARKNAGGPNAIAKNPPLYYVYQAAFYKLGSGLTVLNRAYLMRLANLPIYLATILFAWLLAAQLFRDVWLRVVATALVALQPMVAYMSSVVNPDIALAAMWTAFAYVAVRMVLLGPSVRRVVAVVALVGASALTHGRGTALVAPAVVALVLSLYRHRARFPRAAWAVPAGAVGLVVAAIALLKSSAAYGGELTLGPNFSVRHFFDYLWQFYLPKLPGMSTPPGPHYGFREMVVQEFLGGRFGSLEVMFSSSIYRTIQLIVVALVVALVVAAIARRYALAPVWDVVVLLGAIVVSELLLLHVVSFRSLSGNTGDPIIVGRYLLPLCAVYGLAGAFLAFAAGRRAGPYVGAVLIALSVALQLGGLGLTVARFYG